MGDGSGHFAQANVRLVGNDLSLLRRQLDRCSSGNPVNPEVNKQTAHSGQPDDPVTVVQAFNQVDGLPVDFNHRQNVSPVIDQRDVAFDEELFGGVQEFLFTAVCSDIAVFGGYPFFGTECLFKLVVQKCSPTSFRFVCP